MHQKMVYGLLLGSLALAGCAGNQRAASPTTSTTVDVPVSQTAPATAPTPYPVTGSATDWKPPLFLSPEEEASYYVSRLADRRFVSTYGDRNNPRIWYIAAERLGEIGLPAVPLLFSQLHTADEYEQMLVLYALQLATQDPLLMARTGGDYVALPTVLEPSGNAENVQIAQQWWQKNAAYLNQR